MSGVTTVNSDGSWIKQELKKDFTPPNFEGSRPEILLTHSRAYASTAHPDGN